MPVLMEKNRGGTRLLVSNVFNMKGSDFQEENSRIQLINLP